MHLFTWSPAQYQALNPIWIFMPQPDPGLGIHARRQARPRPADRGEIRTRLRRRRRRLLHLSASAAALAGSDGKVSSWYMIWGYGFYLARRTAGQRPGPGDDRALRAGAHGRLHDGRVLRRHRHLAVPRRRGRRTTPAFRRTSPIRSQSLPIYTSLFNKLGIVALGCTVLAIALLPLMKRLSNSASRQQQGDRSAPGHRRRALIHRHE